MTIKFEYSCNVEGCDRKASYIGGNLVQGPRYWYTVESRGGGDTKMLACTKAHAIQLAEGMLDDPGTLETAARLGHNPQRPPVRGHQSVEVTVIMQGGF